MEFLLMMNYGNIRDKATFVFQLICRTTSRNKITFPELVVFYFKIIDQFENSKDPDLLLNEDFSEYFTLSVEEKEILLREFEDDLKSSITLANIFFNLMEVKLKDPIIKHEFVNFMEIHPKAIELLNFIDISDNDFKNIQSLNRNQRYIEDLEKIISQLTTAVENQNLNTINHINPITISRQSQKNISNIMETVNLIQKEIEESYEESIIEANSIPKPRSKNKIFLTRRKTDHERTKTEKDQFKTQNYRLFHGR